VIDIIRLSFFAGRFTENSLFFAKAQPKDDVHKLDKMDIITLGDADRLSATLGVVFSEHLL
jgi:hypothetical protein